MDVAPALEPIRFLAGSWDIELSNTAFLSSPDEVVHGTAAFEFVEDGRLLVQRQGDGDATWTIGRDDASESFTALYSDARGVSRVYDMTLADGIWRVWRDNPDFSQRFEATIADDRDTISGRWEKRAAGGDWEHDFDVSYRRVRR